MSSVSSLGHGAVSLASCTLLVALGEEVSGARSQLLAWSCRARKNTAAVRSSRCVRLMLLVEVDSACNWGGYLEIWRGERRRGS